MRLPSPPGYGEVVTLDRQAHAGLGLVPATDHLWTSALTAAAIGLVEFSRAALDYPLAFVRRGERYDAVAVLGLRAGENLFVDASGHWRPGAYVPAGIRLHPLCLAEIATGDSDAAPRTLVAVQADRLGKQLAVGGSAPQRAGDAKDLVRGHGASFQSVGDR